MSYSHRNDAENTHVNDEWMRHQMTQDQRHAPSNREELRDSATRLAAEYTANGNASLAWYFEQFATALSETAPIWISVGERLPPPYKTVLLDCDNQLRSTGYMKDDGRFMIDAEDLSDGSHWIVTHWQEIYPNTATQYRMGESASDAPGNSPASNASSGDLTAALCVERRICLDETTANGGTGVRCDQQCSACMDEDVLKHGNAAALLPPFDKAPRSETPRTDERATNTGYVRADFARQLERELAEAMKYAATLEKVTCGQGTESILSRPSLVATDSVLLPRELTAENGAKAALMGEFSFQFGDSTPNVPWTTIKEIHRAVVKLLGTTPPSPLAAPGQIEPCKFPDSDKYPDMVHISVAATWKERALRAERMHDAAIAARSHTAPKKVLVLDEAASVPLPDFDSLAVAPLSPSSTAAQPAVAFLERNAEGKAIRVFLCNDMAIDERLPDGWVRQFLYAAPLSATVTPNVAAFTDRIGELEETIQELVHLKDMHDEIERIKPTDLSGPRNYRAEELEEDYKNRKPLAWQRARSMLE